MEKQVLHISSEEQLYSIWHFFCSEHLYSHDRRLRGIFAGVLNKSDGPDFQGAEFQLDGKIYRGDIEIHKSIGDWYAHGHHLDRRYDAVVLHLVWEDVRENAIPVINSKQLPVTTYSIKNFAFSKRKNPNFNAYCIRKDLKTFLQQMAIIRLTEKSRQMSYYCEKYGFDQALYCMMLRILGMPNNSDNFERLAQVFNWQSIQTLKYTSYPDISYWRMLFYTCAGLLGRLPDQDQDCGRIPFPLTVLLHGEIWQHAGQRPCNSPEHHLQGLAHFIHQLSDVSLYDTFYTPFKNRWPYPYLFMALRKVFAVKSAESGNCFWGKAKITEIIGNVLIPFFYYLANDKQSAGFASYLEDFFLYLPGTGSYAKLRQLDTENRINNEIGNKFYINQALLTISSRHGIHTL
jgi:hypothetical protein